MIDDGELALLLRDLESDRVERKESFADTGRIRQAVCAFANDMPDHGMSGVVFVGARDDGSCAALPVTDKLLRDLADMRSDGNILPTPTMTVQKRTVDDCELAVVIVEPSLAPPVRYNGRIWIRVGPRRATASVEEERRLTERRQAPDLPWDLHAVTAASIGDLDLELFERTYLPAAVHVDVLSENERASGQQLQSLRFLSLDDPAVPTVTGLLTLGKSPADFVPGAYVQFLRIDGAHLADPILDQKVCHGPLPAILRELDEIMTAHVRIATDIVSAETETRRPPHAPPHQQPAQCFFRDDPR